MRLKKRFYKKPEQNAAFDRCIGVMTRMIQKYGPAVLAEVRKADEAFALPHHKRPRSKKYLQCYLEYICRHNKNDAA